jgi:hypothetical protein
MKMWRALALLVLAGVIPACGGGHPGPPPPPPAEVLFADDFNGPSLDPHWAVTGSGAFSFDSVGSPPPSLSTAPPPGSAPGDKASLDFTAIVPPFPSTSVTFSVDVLVRAISSRGGEGFASTVIFDATSSAILARATSSLTGALGSTVEFEITGSLGPAFADTGGFHRLEFSIDASGVASWFVDGGAIMVKPSFPVTNLGFSLRNDSDSVFDFDSVLVTSP